MIPIRFAIDNRLPVPNRREVFPQTPDSAPDSTGQGPLSPAEANRLVAGRQLAATLVAEADRLLGPHLGASFSVADVVLWSAVGDSLEGRLDDLRMKVLPAPGQVVAGITYAVDPGAGTGLASYREGLLVVALRSGVDARLFVHELAHLFGAVHVPGERGLMATAGAGDALDPLNTQLVGPNRRRRFDPRSFPLPSEDLAEARRVYREAWPRAPDADALLAQICLEQGDLECALEAAERNLGRDSDAIETINVRAIVLRRLGRDAEALAEYERAIARRPTYAALHYNLAIALDHLGELARAQEAYERCIALDPANASAHSNLARVLARRGAAGLALAAARRALEIAPDFTGARVNLAMAWLEAGDATAAEREARQAVTERPDLADAHEALGAALLAAGHPEAALASFRKAAELDPTQPRFKEHEVVALRNLGRSRYAAGDFAGARAALERATTLDPGSAAAWSEWADMVFERGEREAARAAYERLLALRPDDAAAHNNLAVLLFRSGDVAGARRHVAEAQRLGLSVHADFLRALAEAEVR